MSDTVLTDPRALFREEADERPAPPRRRRVFVGRDGRIVVGDDVAPGRDDRQLSEVHPAVFA